VKEGTVLPTFRSPLEYQNQDRKREDLKDCEKAQHYLLDFSEINLTPHPKIHFLN